MLIKRKSIFSGNERELDLPVTADQLKAWQSGTLVQHAFPQLTPGQREFIMTGIIDEEWDAEFKEEEED